MTEMKYNEALKRLEEIIDGIEREQIDVDELSQKVKEAVSILNACKQKIEKAEIEVNRIVEEMNANESKIKGDNNKPSSGNQEEAFF